MDTIRLPRPATSTPVETAMAARHTSREFAARELSDQHLSDLLWAMYGVNRPDGKRTVPASMGLYILDIYVVRPDGIYLFNPDNTTLEPRLEGDHRALAGAQEFVATAPLSVVIYADFDRFKIDDPQLAPLVEAFKMPSAYLDAGAAAENAYLFCASQGINVVERLMVDEKAFSAALGLPASNRMMVGLTFGYPPAQA